MERLEKINRKRLLQREFSSRMSRWDRKARPVESEVVPIGSSDRLGADTVETLRIIVFEVESDYQCHFQQGVPRGPIDHHSRSKIGVAILETPRTLTREA